jgi:hypothetical protein
MTKETQLTRDEQETAERLEANFPEEIEQPMRLQTKLDSLGVTLSLAFLGYQPETAKPKADRWPHFAWRVTLQRGSESYSSDYRTGIGYAKPMPKGWRHSLPDREAKELWLKQPKNAIPPTSADIAYSLMSDAQFGSETFEDFCANCGYDTDSRKAFDTYLACQGALNGMRRLFREHFEAVADATQDY